MAGTISRPNKTLAFPKAAEVPKNRRGWHLDKSINLPFLLSLAIFVLGAFAYEMNKQEKTVKNEQGLENLKAEVKELKQDVKTDIRELNKKLDEILKEMRR